VFVPTGWTTGSPSRPELSSVARAGHDLKPDTGSQSPLFFLTALFSFQRARLTFPPEVWQIFCRLPGGFLPMTANLHPFLLFERCSRKFERSLVARFPGSFVWKWILQGPADAEGKTPHVMGDSSQVPPRSLFSLSLAARDGDTLRSVEMVPPHVGTLSDALGLAGRWLSSSHHYPRVR